ncbi:MAG: peptidoglycan-binding protein [Flavobacterium sp. MedPE-SWcel]|mgnify:CR=1 FL=1|uniref:GDSL-type esterase/lipase family protein n=1 Tax=uncultured Flavobacterium sp. TaxID=165435 RepID=UPI00090F3868|nr:GDSL-type esterase/lipase family protein [uncultured Flavobacterium sp.]OIQ15780.1 MAG: peptidoglycan-binding protein [Flavobacterium sp. MedPE-SWcel]
MLNKLLVLFFSMMCAGVAAQDDVLVLDGDEVEEDVTIDPVKQKLLDEDNNITNTTSLDDFFQRLQLLEEGKRDKINIVHIGDSHLQADVFSDAIRKKLQEYFGNAGCGFSFPHKLARTNGSVYIKYRSNVVWDKRRNVYPIKKDIAVGLSGTALTTNEDFVIRAEVLENEYDFNTIKIITPNNEPTFNIAITDKKIELESDKSKSITHKIKSGEALSIIARKYGTSVKAIKSANGMRSNNIRAGKTLKIPTKQKEKRKISKSEFTPLPLVTDSLSHYYHSEQALSKIYLLPNGKKDIYNLSGLVLEKDAPGLVYHSIGVNGAKTLDYNKYALFFEQLPVLNPDLIIVSLGTNESFDKIAVEEYMEDLNEFIATIRSKNPNAYLLVMTPPPSLFKRKYPNTFAATYAKTIIEQEKEMDYATWDLFSEFGGTKNVNRNVARGLMKSDRIHYSAKGYQKQGFLFVEAFMKAFSNFKTSNK